MSIAFHDYADVRAPARDPRRESSVPQRRRIGQPDSRRPASGQVGYRTSPAGLSSAAHPLPRRKPRSGGPIVTICAALLTAFVVASMIGLAHLRAGDVTSTPGATAVVQVRGGETLSDVAVRIAPDSPVGQVVAEIIELNAMSGAGVHAGQTLITPASANP